MRAVVPLIVTVLEVGFEQKESISHNDMSDGGFRCQRSYQAFKLPRRAVIARPDLQKLDHYTLEDLLRPKSKLRRLLGVDQEKALAQNLA